MAEDNRPFVEVELPPDCKLDEAIDALEKDVEKASELYKVILSFPSLGGLIRRTCEIYLQFVKKRHQDALEVYEWLNGEAYKSNK